MPSREIRDFQQDNEKPVITRELTPKPVENPTIQIKIDEFIQKTLVDIVLDDFEKCKDDRRKRDFGLSSKSERLSFDNLMKSIKDLFFGRREAKTVPWRFCSNRSLRIGTAILEMMHARLFSAVWNEDLTRWRPGETSDSPKVERISKFMDWWIRVWAPINSFFDNWVKVTAGFGDSLTEITWEVDERESGSKEQVPVIDELGQPLINQDGTPAVTEQPILTREEKTKVRIIPKESVYLMKGARDIQKDMVIIEEEFLFKDLEAMEVKGQAINITSELAKNIVVNIPEGNFSEEERERLRRIKIRNVPVKVVRWYGHYDVDGTGFEQSIRIMISPDYKIYLGGVNMKDITKSGLRPLVFAKYSSRIDSPDELMGEGILEQGRELFEEVDAIFNQMTDANTLSVLRPGFYDPHGDIDAPAIKLAPNKIIPVSDPQTSIAFPDLTFNTSNLINSINLVMEFIERLTAANSTVLGKPDELVGGSGTATRTAAIVQNAEIRFSKPSERLKLAAAEIVTRILDMIQLNIPEGMETRVLGEKGEQLFNLGELTDQGISGKFDAYILNDPTMGSKATERELDSLVYSLMIQNILVATDPVKLYRVTADLLKSHGKNPEEILGPAPNMDDIDDPEDENTLMVQGDFDRVKPNLAENHMLHIQKHMELAQSPSLMQIGQKAPELVNQILQFNQAHIQQHQLMFQALTELVKKVGGGKGATDNSGPGKDGAGNSSPKDDSNIGLENIPGPAAQALAAQRNGKVQ